MEFDELLVTTKVDALVRLVKEKGTIELGIAAKLLDVGPESVEEWGHILEEEGIIKIDYKLTKAYFTWVQPTEVEVAKEQEKFTRQKVDLAQEIQAVRESIGPEKRKLEEMNADFKEIYDKLLPKFEKFQSQMSAISSLKESTFQKHDSYADQLDALTQKEKEISSSLNSFKDELARIRKELKDIKDSSPAEKKFREVESFKNELSELGDRLKLVDSKIVSLQKTLPKEKLDRDAVQSSLEPLKRDFAEFKRSNAILRENIINLKEAFEILGTVDSSVKERGNRIILLEKELHSMLVTTKELSEKLTRVSDNIKSEISAVSGFKDSMEFVKVAFTKFPDQKEIFQRIDDISAKEKSLETKFASVEKSLSASAIPQISLEEVTSLKKELDEKRKELSREVAELFSAVEQESNTYSTFQKIKEKALSSIEVYSMNIQKVDDELKKLVDNTKQLNANLDSSLEKMKGKVDNRELQEIISAADTLSEKRTLMDEIAESLEALTNASDGISKKINLLSKEAELLSIRASSAAPASPQAMEVQAKEGELRQQLSLTRSEQIEFDRKRGELRDLIKKLWEQS